ncbi:MAG: tRNA (adenosine(37)-N6)-dimethylallyltransferase MiaA [Thermodesulfobacteriota bacterium]|nr:tRNA (adenosine(37)-N6)-dimethylallyltransferase MiaA [Thermodesulfobacteriota bacterium]
MKKPKIAVIVGPTAIGKSSLALDLASEIGGELISADSMQVYKHMDIGTAKPTPEERRKVKHHLIDVVFPDEQFSAALFKDQARNVIWSLNKKGKIPIVEGGTGLYIKALIKGLFKSPQTDPALRQALKEKAASDGNDSLHKELMEKDPSTAERLHPNDTFRIIRALEVCSLTQKPLSEHLKKHNFNDSPFETLHIGLHMERYRLYQRIEKRADMMISMGFVDEVMSLLELGYSRDLNSMQGLGYKQIVGYLMGESSLNEAVSQLKRETKRYAKRQVTWFNANSEIDWHVFPDDYIKIRTKVRSFFEV